MTGADPYSGGTSGGRDSLLSWVIGTLVLVAALGMIWAADRGVSGPVGRGGDAPDFELARLSGDRIALSDYRGRVVLVNFWATWCKPCEDEMPSMERLYQALSPAGFELVAVSVDETPEEVARFRDRLGVSFPIALDPGQEVSRRYQTQGFPESLLIDADGRIVERYVGPRDWSIYEPRIRSLMAQGS